MLRNGKAVPDRAFKNQGTLSLMRMGSIPPAENESTLKGAVGGFSWLQPALAFSLGIDFGAGLIYVIFSL